MLKRLLLILTIIFTVTSAKAMAADNYLNSVLLERTDNNYNVVLRSDSTAKVKKDIQSSDKIVLTLKGITASSDLSTLYKDTPDINNLIVENAGNNELKIYIQAHEISKANIIFDTPNSAPIPVGDSFGTEKAAWSLISIAILFLAMKSAKSIHSSHEIVDINQTIRDREIEMYKDYKRDLTTLPSINYKVKNNSYLHNKIVRKREETIRNYQHLSRI